MERDPKNTQVLVQEDEHGVRVFLQDADGVFLEVEPEADEGDGSGEGDGDGIRTGDVEGLRLELQAVKDAQEALEKEVTELRQKLEREKAKSNNLWDLNCAQLAEFDSTLMEKDEEIA